PVAEPNRRHRNEKKFEPATVPNGACPLRTARQTVVAVLTQTRLMRNLNLRVRLPIIDIPPNPRSGAHGQRKETAAAVSRNPQGHLFRGEEDPHRFAEDGEGGAFTGPQI